jgi:hypothetical protein
MTSGSDFPAEVEGVSLDNISNEEQKLEIGKDQDVTAPLSTIRLFLLIMGLCMSIFLIALDFVGPVALLANAEYYHDSNS